MKRSIEACRTPRSNTDQSALYRTSASLLKKSFVELDSMLRPGEYIDII